MPEQSQLYSRPATQTTTLPNEPPAPEARDEFGKVWSAVIYDKRLSHSAVRVYAALAAHANYKTGTAFPGMRTLAKRVGMSTSTVNAAIRQLEKCGHVAVQRRPGAKYGRGSNLYTGLDGPGRRLTLVTPENVVEIGQSKPEPRRGNRDNRVAEIATQQDPSNENSSSSNYAIDAVEPDEEEDDKKSLTEEVTAPIGAVSDRPTEPRPPDSGAEDYEPTTDELEDEIDAMLAGRSATLEPIRAVGMWRATVRGDARQHILDRRRGVGAPTAGPPPERARPAATECEHPRWADLGDGERVCSVCLVELVSS